MKMNSMRQAVVSNAQNEMSRVWQKFSDEEGAWARSLGFRDAQDYWEATQEAFEEEMEHQDQFEGEA